ncbi:RDD family protein [Vibrio nigripulchritudo]|uniref:RDD family protein n=1 Tax=Vibrio nigripulchritudo TaxID=28173 RepID=UPI00190C9E58|nr:RDD family protein [Vibrio nigripulchritudo]
MSIEATRVDTEPQTTPDLSHYRLASPGRRYVAQVIDGILTWCIYLFLLSSLNYFSVERDLTDIISLCLAGMYFVFSDGLPKGKSLGKHLLGMTVLNKKNGEYCSLWRSFLRNFFSPILWIFDAMFILGKKRQRLGDKFASTIVIRDQK